MENLDIEKLNRENYKSMMDTLSMPGKIAKIEPLFDSNLLAIANVLLFSEVSFFYNGDEDMSLVEAITNPQVATNDKADYIFSDVINDSLIVEAKKGDYMNPDFSATLVFKCEDFNTTKVSLSGPGIDKTKKVSLPCDKSFIETLMDKNSDYPLGVEVYFINTNSEIIALSRTTKIEVL